MKRLYMISCFLLCMVNIIAQQKLNPIEKKIKDLYDKEEYVEAYNIAIDEAMNGSAFAQTIIGKMYNDGNAVEHNDLEVVLMR